MARSSTAMDRSSPGNANNEQTDVPINDDTETAKPKEGTANGEEDPDSDYDSDFDSEDDDRSSVSSFTRELESLDCFTFESSYISPGPRNPYAFQRDDVNYDYCTPQDLRGFVKARRLQDPYPPGLTLKYYYIRVLEEADKKLSFRFMDLPLEMREFVYTELLTIPDDVCSHHRHCFPQILRTCKQVHGEARGLIYAVNTFECDFFIMICGCGAHGMARAARVHRETCEQGLYGGPIPFEAVPSGISAYPAWFHQIQHLRINARVDTDDDKFSIPNAILDSAVIFMNKCILTLTSFLMEGHCLKTLEMNLSVDDLNNETKLEHAAYPLRWLRGIKDVQINGHALRELFPDFAKEIQQTGAVYNTVKHYALLKAEASAYVDLCYALNPTHTIEIGREEFDVPDMVSWIDDACRDLTMLFVRGIQTQEQEQKVQEQLVLLKKLMAHRNDQRVAAMLNTLNANKRARLRYQREKQEPRNPMSGKVSRDIREKLSMAKGNPPEDWFD